MPWIVYVVEIRKLFEQSDIMIFLWRVWIRKQQQCQTLPKMNVADAL